MRFQKFKKVWMHDFLHYTSYINEWTLISFKEFMYTNNNSGVDIDGDIALVMPDYDVKIDIFECKDKLTVTLKSKDFLTEAKREFDSFNLFYTNRRQCKKDAYYFVSSFCIVLASEQSRKFYSAETGIDI